MVGDTQDMLARLKAVLPARWFADSTPVLNALLSGLAAAWSWLYVLYGTVKLQTRIATATDTWLDLTSTDFFGGRLPRRASESDDDFRVRILLELKRPRATRPALVESLSDLTGRAPVIFEPSRPTDTCAYGIAAGYDVAGAWGSLTLPCQCFVTAFRPHGAGIAAIPGWDFGAWNVGASAYANLAQITGQVTDADIYAAIAEVLPAAVIAWARITD